jgi:hypothetical protein
MSVGEVSASMRIRANTYRDIETGTVPRAKTLKRVYEWLAEDTVTVPLPIIRRSPANHSQDAYPANVK